jgi:myo-inositol catabolism protein IolH
LRIAVESGIVGHLPLDEALGVIARAGYHYVELSHPQFRAHAAAPGQVAGLRCTLDALGLQLVALLDLLGSAQPETATRTQAADHWKRAVEVAAQLGCPLLTSELGGQKVPPDAARSAFAASVDDLRPTLQAAGVTLAFECHPGDFIESSNEAVGFLRGLGCPHVRYLFCAPHTFIIGSDVAGMVQHAGDLLAHVHIADTHRPERILATRPPLPHEHLVPGWGEVDFPELVRSLQAIGYTGSLSACVFSHQDTPVAALVHTRRCMEDWLQGRFAPPRRLKGDG